MSKLASWKEAIYSNQPATWWGHGYVSSQSAVLPLVAADWLGWLPGIWPPSAYVIACGLWMAFYLVREQGDEMRHRLAKDYDTVNFAGTPRTDKTADSLGPVVVAFTAVTCLTFAYGPWWLPLLPFAATTFALLRSFARVVRRAGV